MKKIIISLVLLASVISLNSCKKNIITGCINNLASNYNADATEDDGSCIFIIPGQPYQGGIVAYTFQQGDPGYDANVKHGLIAAPYDQARGLGWGCLSTTIAGADGIAIGSGNQNTLDIINGCSESGAAKLCGDLVLGGYSDWFLPSKDELKKLYLNKVAIGGFDEFGYWTSTESTQYTAWFQMFTDGTQYPGDQWNNNKSVSYYVRAVRAF